MFRPRVRMPMWAAVAVVAAAYLVRSAMRGFDFRPDLPIDAVLGAVLIGLIGLRLYLSRPSAEDVDEHPQRQVDEEDTGARREGHDHDV